MMNPWYFLLFLCINIGKRKTYGIFTKAYCTENENSEIPFAKDILLCR